VEAQRPDQPFPIRDHALVESLDGELPGVALTRGKDHAVFFVKLLRREHLLSSNVDAHKLGKNVEHLAEYVLVAFGHDRYFAQSILLEQQLAAAHIVQYVYDYEVNSVIRKKLFRF
jgi:hypothetical protein